ncbi:hypothetical protein [Arcanobacterium hippocoleae]|uniref:hypothetical protein n=1 Tax=Arcanobacterium hippocoleae TaxID=149017 RepID=UPI00333F3DC7
MGIPEIGANETAKRGQVYNFEDFKFNEAESDPMAGNIEWDVFTNADGLKLVRMQHNEMPATFGWDCQPIKPGSHFYLYHELKRCLPDAGQKPVADEVLNSERQAITAVLAANDTAEKLAAAQVELAELKNKFQTEQVRTADLQKQLNAATVQTNTVKKQLEAAQAKAVKDLEQARKEADAAKQAALDAANKEHKAAAQVAAKKLADAQSRLDEAENQLAAANQAAQEAAEQHAVAIKVLEQKIKNAEAQRVVLQKQLTAVIEQKNVETAKNKALMQERDKVKQLALGLENQLKAGKLELTKLKSTATAAQQAADKKIAELQARLDELQAQLDTAKQDIALKLNGNKADGSRVPEVSQPEMVQSAEGKTAIKDQQSPGDAHQHNIVKGESKVNIQGESKVKSAKQTAANADYNQVNTVKTLSKTGASEIITLGGVAMLILLAGVAVAATYRRLR